MVINWPGLNDKEKTELIPTLSTTDNWILLTHPLGAKNKSQPPLGESQRIVRAEGKCSRHKGWWPEGKDKLASHSMTTEVWISTRGRISEATRIIIQEALEEEDKKDTPSFGREDLETGDTELVMKARFVDDTLLALLCPKDQVTHVTASLQEAFSDMHPCLSFTFVHEIYFLLGVKEKTPKSFPFLELNLLPEPNLLPNLLPVG